MASVFAESGDATVLRAGKAIISFNSSGSDVIALQVQVSFQRPVEIVPSLGETRVISLGEPTGQLTIGTVLMSDVPGVLSDDGCDPFVTSISFEQGCDMAGKKVTCSNCVLQQVNLQAQGGRGYVGHDLQIVFTKLEID